MSFGVDLQLQIIGIILALLFYFDALVTINTEIFNDGILITNRILIIKNMFRTRLFSDILPCIFLTFVYIYEASEWDYLNLIFIARIYKTQELFERINVLLVKTDALLPLYKMVILILKIYFWAHFIACLWHYMGYISAKNYPDDINWLKSQGIEKDGWRTKYLFSIYWAVTTMLTVGYGDLTPTNKTEMFFNIWAMFLGCAVFGYSMNSIGEILKYSSRKNSVLQYKFLYNTIFENFFRKIS